MFYSIDRTKSKLVSRTVCHLFYVRTTTEKLIFLFSKIVHKHLGDGNFLQYNYHRIRIKPTFDEILDLLNTISFIFTKTFTNNV